MCTGQSAKDKFLSGTTSQGFMLRGVHLGYIGSRNANTSGKFLSAREISVNGQVEESHI